MDEFEKREQSRGTIKVTAQIVNLKLRYTPHAWHPATDLFETADEYLIKVEIAGLNEEDITVCIEGNSVLVSGERPLVNPDGAFHRLEIPYGEFNTMVDVPNDIDHKNIQAIYKNGFLEIRLPKILPVNIKVK
ncbi:Hsp20/alpha crystallin family protein [Pelolinea submarina]|uniref:HSP20 family molecular chaperone IbpA n=1 Tax=Pelolinea submarina TaxID=913107 RepID=A0A347ZTC6_9CHLR|nr:Hsp20/alpha crystallin family protein [Pelolinea submarina]REG10868.1 HSP20 family molecular chaperone IbpA [Pelolinea submarina]BBB48557.1 HSP20 family protein [Pelolinea submarina]